MILRPQRPSPTIGALCLVIVSATIGCQRSNPSNNVTTIASGKVALAEAGEPAVEMTIDYGDGARASFTRILWHDGMTVLAALEHAGEHARGIRFEKSGSGESALLTKIDDLENEAGRDGKNWLYRVNGKLADKSFDAYVLSPGDVILWKFEKYE